MLDYDEEDVDEVMTAAGAAAAAAIGTALIGALIGLNLMHHLFSGFQQNNTGAIGNQQKIYALVRCMPVLAVR